MILIQYTLKKVFKNQSIILILLFLVCICQKLIKVLGLDNNIPIYLIVLYLFLNIPELGKLLIPFSLFLSVIITYYQLHIHNEILAMYSCGISKYTLIYSVLLCSIITACIAFLNLSWLCPYCEQCQDNILSKVKKNAYFNTCIDKKFQISFDKNLVLFIDKINNKKLKNVFIASKKQNGYNNIIKIITANQGDIQNDSNGFQSIILNTGTYYEIHNNQKTYTNICITKFSRHHMLIDDNLIFFQKTPNTINHMSINQLWHSSLPESQIEFNWRLTLLISIFIMPMIALLLMINIKKQYLSNFLLAMLLYTIFFFSHILLKSYNISSPIYTIICIWLINFIYFIIIYWLNLKKSFLLKYF